MAGPTVDEAFNVRFARLRTLARLNRIIASSADLDEMLAGIARTAADVVAAELAAIWVADPASVGVELRAASSERLARKLPLQRLRLGEGAVGWIAAQRSALNVPDVLGDDRFVAREWLVAHNLRSFLGLPVILQGALVGVLALHGPDPFHPGPNADDLLKTLASQAALAIGNARLLAESEARRRVAEALADVGRLLSEALDPGVVGQRIAHGARVLLGVHSSALFQVDGTSGDAVGLAVSGAAELAFGNAPVLPRGTGLVGLAIATGRPVATPDVLADVRFAIPPEQRAGIERADYRAALAVPLVVKDRVIGALSLGDRLGRAFDDEEVRLARGFADQAALALENARLFQQEQARRRQVEAVRAAAEELGRELDPANLLQPIHRRAAGLLGTATGTLWLWDESAELLVPWSWHGHGEWLRDLCLQLGEGVAGTVALRREGLIVNDYRASPHAHPVILERTRLTAAIAEPLIHRDRLLGVLELDNEGHGRLFAEQDREMLGLFAAQAASALENVRLFERQREAAATAERQRARAEALAAVGQAVSASLDLDEVLGVLVGQAVAATGADAAAVRERDPASGVLRVRRAHGLSTRYWESGPLRRGAGLSGAALAAGHPVWTSDVQNDPQVPVSPEARALHAAEGVRAILSVPLRGRERPFGVLNLYWRYPRPFEAEEIDFAVRIAGQAALAIENARLFREEQERRRQVEVAREVAAEITRELDLATLLGLIQWRGAELVGASSGTVYLWDEAAQVLIPQAWFGLGEWMRSVRINLGEGLTGLVAQRREGLILNDYRGWPHTLAAFLEHTSVHCVLAEPLLYRDRLLGVTILNRDDPGWPFTEQDRNTFAPFVAQAAIALENARLYQEERTRTESFAALLRAGRAVTSSLDLPQILETIAGAARELTGASLASLLLVEAGGELAWRLSGGPLREALEREGGLRVMAVGKALSEEVAARGQPVWAPDMTADPRGQHGELLRRHGPHSYLGVPIQAGRRVLGVLHVVGPRGGSLTEARRDVLESLAAHAAIAIENARLFHQQQARRRQVEAVRAVSEEITRELDLPSLLGLIQRRAMELLEASAGAVYLWDEQTHHLVPQAWHGRGDWMRDVRIRLGEGIAGQVAERREGLIVNDFRSWPHALPVFRERTAITAILAEPLLYRDRLLGVITIDNQETGRPFAAQDRETLALFAAQAAIAIENARLYAETREAFEELAAIHDAGQAITQSLDLQETLQQILGAAMHLTGTDKGIIHLVDEEWQALVTACVIGPAGGPTAPLPLAGRSLAAACVREGQVLIAESPETDPRCSPELQAAYGNKALIAVPLRSGERILGVLDLGDLQRPRRFGTREIGILERLAQQAVVAIENARLFQQEQERRRQLEAVRDVTGEILRELDLSALLDLINRRAVELVGATSGMVFLWDEAAQVLVPQAWCGLGDWAQDVHVPLGEDLSGVVAQRREGLICNDYRKFPKANREFLVRTGVTAALGEPLLYRDRLLGVIGINNEGTGRSFTKQDQETLRLFAAQAALAIENARLYGEAGRQRREAEVFARLAQDINASLHLDTVLRVVVEEARALCGSDLSGIALRVPGTETWAFRHRIGARTAGHRDIRILPGRGVGGQVLTSGRPFRTDQYAEDRRISRDYLAVIQAEGIVAEMVVPIQIGGQVEGLLYVDNRTPRPFTDRDEAILLRLADHAAIALCNAQLFEREKAARTAAEASEERLRDLVQDLDAIVWEAEAAPFRFAFVNQRAETILGYPVERWTADPDFAATLIHPEDRPAALALRQAATAEGRDHAQEFRAVAADGRVVWLRDIVRLARDAEGRAPRLRGVMVDITQRKRTEEALREREEQLRQAQKMEAVGRLAGGIAHDFNNLMAAITIYGDLLVDGLPEGHRLHHAADQVRRVSDRASALVKQLLAFSRRQVLQPKVLDLNAVVAELEPMLQRLLGEDIILVTRPYPGLHKVRADPGQIEQVIINLAVNARDAMPQGGRLTIETANLDAEGRPAGADAAAGSRPGPSVVLSVRDSGIGMDAETRAHIFEPFFTTKEPGRGTGLGLATVYGIIQQHQGAIGVDSAPGQGTTIRIFLPAALEGPEEAPALPLARGGERGAETILLVEDEVAVREAVREVLQRHGYTVLEATNGAEALQVSAGRSQPIHLLLTDVVMPEISGPEAAQRMARERPGLKVLYMSGYTDDALGSHGVLEAGTALLQKPFSMADLTRRIRDLLDAPDQ